jgi:hypothetical protein
MINATQTKATDLYTSVRGVTYDLATLTAAERRDICEIEARAAGRFEQAVRFQEYAKAMRIHGRDNGLACCQFRGSCNG